jgi:arginase family enzyme
MHHLPALEKLLTFDLPDKPIYVHFDSDVLRLSDLSAVNYPAEGGPSLEIVEASLARLAETGRIAAISMTMWNPELDDEAGSAGQMVLGLVSRWLKGLAGG